MHFTPTLTKLRPDQIAQMHDVDEERSGAIVARIAAGETNLPPVLVLHDGYQYVVLDGHHRVAAAVQVGMPEVPVLLIGRAKAARMLKWCFRGEWPEQISDYDRYITVDGVPYSKIRNLD